MEKRIVGTSTTIEKSYYRLSVEPDPSTIRPKAILQKAFELVKSKYKSATYEYLSDQLRSIRQDMVLQQIKDEFAVEVYEAHARLALENRDLSHFNQCQTQLFDLYHEGYSKGNDEEFLGYRILYAGLFEFYIDLCGVLKEAKRIKSESVKHAMNAVQAYYNKNYLKFIALRRGAVNLNGTLMDLFMNRVRVLFLSTIASALYYFCRLDQISTMGLKTEVVKEWLGFSGEEECRKFILEAGGKLNEATGKFASKESIEGLSKSPILLRKI